jgi:TatD DNase family protein
MIVDIHTHHSTSSIYPAIRNLTFAESDSIFASDIPGLFSVGIHPCHADDFSPELIDKMMAWSTDKRLVALGECGLDKNSRVSMEQQLNVFEQQIILSEKTGKPLIIHCVGCFNELFELKKKLNPRQLWIIHGFRGKPQLAQQALNAGCSLSFGEHFNVESVRLTPIDRLFVETDESQLLISEIYHSIALIKNCLPEELTAGENFIGRFNQQNIT